MPKIFQNHLAELSRSQLLSMVLIVVVSQTVSSFQYFPTERALTAGMINVSGLDVSGQVSLLFKFFLTIETLPASQYFEHFSGNQVVKILTARS